MKPTAGWHHLAGRTYLYFDFGSPVSWLPRVSRRYGAVGFGWLLWMVAIGSEEWVA